MNATYRVVMAAATRALCAVWAREGVQCTPAAFARLPTLPLFARATAHSVAACAAPLVPDAGVRMAHRACGVAHSAAARFMCTDEQHVPGMRVVCAGDERVNIPRHALRIAFARSSGAVCVCFS
ncbi:hypothetical protein EON67_12045 [archaeon]|nr:MAG: hypothetical protein EON67_12045 [archaeon]